MHYQWTEEEIELYYKNLLKCFEDSLNEETVQMPSWVKTSEDFIKWIKGN